MKNHLDLLDFNYLITHLPLKLKERGKIGFSFKSKKMLTVNLLFTISYLFFSSVISSSNSYKVYTRLSTF